MAKGDDVEVVFVTELAASGFMNGVINMALSTYRFIPQFVPGDPNDPEDEGSTIVAPAPVISANLRFDLRLAMIMRDRLDEIIEENTKPSPKAAN